MMSVIPPGWGVRVRYEGNQRSRALTMDYAFQGFLALVHIKADLIRWHNRSAGGLCPFPSLRPLPSEVSPQPFKYHPVQKDKPGSRSQKLKGAATGKKPDQRKRIESTLPNH